jgi:hypothetical protein
LRCGICQCFYFRFKRQFKEIFNEINNLRTSNFQFIPQPPDYVAAFAVCITLDSTMEAAARSQAVAILFVPSGVEVSVELSSGVHTFKAENSATGLQAFERELIACQLSQPPFICLGAAPDAELAAPFFTEMQGAPFPKFIMAQPMFLQFAKARELSAGDSETLLQAFRNQWPRSADVV